MYLSVLHKRYGELFTFTMPRWGRSIVIHRPEWLEHMRKYDGTIYGKGDVSLSIFKEFPGPVSAFGSEGQEWRMSRRVMRPIFITQSFDVDVSRAMSEIVPVAKELLMNASMINQPIGFNNFYGRVAMVIFCKMALNYETDLITSNPACLFKPNTLVDSVLALNSISSGRLYNPFWRFTEKFDRIGRDFDSHRKELYKIIDHIVHTRKQDYTLHKSNEHHNDFLSTLLADDYAQDPEILRDTLVTLLFAGKDNVQNALSWSLHELSRSPVDWIGQMRAEALSRDNLDGIIKYGDLEKFPVHMAVFYETLRLWPGVPKNARIALKDDVIPSFPGSVHGPIRVAKGDYILWSDYAMMREEKVWGPEANVFNPGRHLNGEGKFVKPPSPKFHAFGAGSRACPGAQLAAYEFVAIWTGFLPFFDLVPLETKERYPCDAFTMSMNDELWVKVVPHK
ncbi:cytochrome P450 [Wolfiporia cocos MD-104 SS10]|uniref:Cytochrome P450 n=1 Tax=Wolfiporia cocos (strain MD-104) TaxID=742152 RepID=A0A2H3J483_WOLCO|nr:cytochrome P450 [Wolfiporia cocos MD-104 SS10]